MGWLAIKELLRREEGGLYFFRTCPEIIRCLPALRVDKVRPTDCATETADMPSLVKLILSLLGGLIFHILNKVNKE